MVFAHMRDETQKVRWLFTRKGTLKEVAFQDRLDDGTLVHKVRVLQDRFGADFTETRVHVTAKGLARLALTFAPRFPGV